MGRERAAQKPKKRLVKMGITLTEKTEYRLRNFAARQRLKPSMVVEQLLVDRFRGEDLPGTPPSSGPAAPPSPEVE